MSGGRLGFIWMAGVRDLRWRRRRFTMATIAAALVFAITLLLSGFGESFNVEVNRVINDVHADGFVVAEGQRGPFMSPRPFPTSVVAEVAASPGVTHAEPLISIIQPDKYLIAHRLDAPSGVPGWTGANRPAAGKPIAADDQVTIDRRISRDVHVGDRLVIGGTPFTVSGLTRGQTILGGQPIAVTTLKAAQQAVFGGYDVVTSVAVTGHPTSLPQGYVFVDRHGAGDDFLKPLNAVTGTIKYLSVLLWLVAAAIVGSVIYISTLERMRDFAVFKATGAATGDLLAALVLQAVLLSVLSSLAAIALTYAIAPSFPVPGVSFPARTVALLPAIGVFVGLIASVAGLRRAVNVDPVTAMGG